MIQTVDNFGYLGPKPNFTRDYYKDRAAMKLVTDNDIDDGHFAYCAETGLHYEYKYTNSIDTILGKWREYKPIDAALNETSTNAVQNKVINTSIQDLLTKYNTLKSTVDTVSGQLTMDSVLDDKSEKGVQNKVLKAKFDEIGASIAGLLNAASDYVRKADVQATVTEGSANPVQSGVLYTRLKTLDDGVKDLNTQITNLKTRVDKVEPLDTALNATSTRPVENKAITAKFDAVSKQMDEMTKRQDALELGSLGNYTYCVAGWKVGDMKPEAVEQYGNPDLLRRWDFYFCDHSKVNSDGTAIVPDAKLKRNNLFRTENGHYAKTIFTNYNCKGLYNISGSQDTGYTASSAFANGENKLYTTAACTEPYYCLAKDFNPAKFWEEFGHEGGLWMKTPGGAGPYQLFELPRPWEEYQSFEGSDSAATPYNATPAGTWGGFGKVNDANACKSVVMGYPKTCYLVDQIEGTTGVKWKGIFFEPVIWDGIDVSKYPMDTTGIGPTPSTAFAPNGTSSTGKGGDRMFTRYIDFYKEFAAGKGGIKMGANCQGHLGEGNASQAFMSEDWTIDGVAYKRFAYGRSYDVSQLTNCNMARNNNADNEKSVPFAEGGYHSRNVFVSSQETIYRTKYLNDTNFFASGISANDAVANEAAWKKYGGIRWKRNGTSAWNYGTWNTTPTVAGSDAQSIRYNSTTSTHFNALLSWWFPKEQVLESQTAASYAVEAGIAPGVEFQFGACGNAKAVTWWYADVPNAPGLQKGEMNCIIYKKFLYALKAYDGTGASATFDVEVILRMSLMNGYNHSGDYWIYYGGGYEQVGTNINNNASVSGSTGNPVDIYTCFDQRNWRSRTDLQEVTKPNYGTFSFEDDPNYWKCWSGTNLGDSYTGVRPSYTAYKEAAASALNQGECFWSYTSNHWTTTPGERVRVGIRQRQVSSIDVRIRGIAERSGLTTWNSWAEDYRIGGSDQLRLEL